MPGCDNYLIVASAEGWLVRFGGRNIGLFKSRSEALHKAVENAHRSGRSGIKAKVYSEDALGVRHLVWTFGVDEYSTAG